jgi:hypothetical protein
LRIIGGSPRASGSPVARLECRVESSSRHTGRAEVGKIERLDSGEQNKNKNKTGTTEEVEMVVRLARETLALASVAGFVWMVCSVARLVA